VPPLFLRPLRSFVAKSLFLFGKLRAGNPRNYSRPFALLPFPPGHCFRKLMPVSLWSARGSVILILPLFSFVASSVKNIVQINSV
ncbi:MAG: hypothetical protein WCG03_02215, partial [Kiritimatiellales bacterium]